MKYTDFNTSVPKLQLGQIVAEANNSHDIQVRLKNGEDVVYEGVARTIRLDLGEIEVDADGFAENCKLSQDRLYIVKTGFKPDTTGLGPVK